MQTLKLILKIVVALVLLVAIGIGGMIGYDHYKSEQRKSAELSYPSGSTKWKWHDEYNRIQISTDPETGMSTLRKVKLSRNQVILAYKNPDYTLSSAVLFFTDCEPDTEIVISKTFSSGKPKKMLCGSKGDRLIYGVHWSVPKLSSTWAEDLDGFSVYEDFSNWDFSILDREITLSKAKPRNKTDQ